MKCSRCGEYATGYAFIRDKRYCDGEGRDCYAEQVAELVEEKK